VIKVVCTSKIFRDICSMDIDSEGNLIVLCGRESVYFVNPHSGDIFADLTLYVPNFNGSTRLERNVRRRIYFDHKKKDIVVTYTNSTTQILRYELVKVRENLLEKSLLMITKNSTHNNFTVFISDRAFELNAIILSCRANSLCNINSG